MYTSYLIDSKVKFNFFDNFLRVLKNVFRTIFDY